MKKLFRNAIYLTILACLFSGCFLQSVHPLITDEEAEIISNLEGRWESEETRWTFFRDSENLPAINLSGFTVSGDINIEFGEGDALSTDQNSYFVIFEDFEDNAQDSVLLIANFGKIGDTYYMDLTVSDIFRDINFKSYHLLPVHTFSKFKIDETGENLVLEMFESDWIADQIRDNRVRIKHEVLGEEVLITASTKELQNFVRKYGNESDAFGNEIDLKRVSDDS